MAENQYLTLQTGQFDDYLKKQLALEGVTLTDDEIRGVRLQILILIQKRTTNVSTSIIRRVVNIIAVLRK